MHGLRPERVKWSAQSHKIHPPYGHGGRENHCPVSLETDAFIRNSEMVSFVFFFFFSGKGLPVRSKKAQPLAFCLFRLSGVIIGILIPFH